MMNHSILLMARKLLIAGVLVLVLAIGTFFGWTIFSTRVPELLPPPQNPEAQTQRLTSVLLIRKVEDLKETAIYLQHREEGRELLRMGTVEEEEEQEEEPEILEDEDGGEEELSEGGDTES
jgi:hypothetical protein